MNSRILLILKTKNISASKFADEIGVQRSSISHILSGRNNPSLDFIQKTLIRFPDISPDWILTGKGSMYMQPDLFSAATDLKTEGKSKSDEKSYAEEYISSDIDQMTEIIERTESEKQLKPRQPKSNEKTVEVKDVKMPDVVNNSEGKKIERIIIFYTDKTCLQYTPE